MLARMLLAAVGTFLAASVQSATGFGFALVLGPALFAVMQPEEAVTLILVLGLVINLLMLFGEGRRRRIAWPEIRPLLAAAVPGIVCGVFVLEALSASVLQVAVGVAVIGAALLRLRSRAPVVPRGPLPASALGFGTGVLTTSTSVNGPPLVVWLNARGLGPAELRDSLAACFLILSLAGAVAVGLLVGTDRSAGRIDWLFVLVPLLVGGHAAGRLLFDRLEPERFERVLTFGVIAAGLASIAAGLF